MIPEVVSPGKGEKYVRIFLTEISHGEHDVSYDVYID